MTVGDRSGFTLIELMIVVAIIGIPSRRLALPTSGSSRRAPSWSRRAATFRQFQTRTKLVEARGNLKSIATAENAYYTEQGAYLAAAATPPLAPSPVKQVWAGGGLAAFDTIGFIPEGSLFFQYAVDINGASTAFTAAALGDLDGDAITSDFGYVHPVPGATSGAASSLALACAGGGVIDPAQPAGAFNVVGPCAPADGRSEF